MAQQDNNDALPEDEPVRRRGDRRRASQPVAHDRRKGDRRETPGVGGLIRTLFRRPDSGL